MGIHILVGWLVFNGISTLVSYLMPYIYIYICQMANRVGPQSITVKKWAPLQWVISIATRCHVCLTFKAPLWLVHGCRIDRLTLFTFSDDGFHCGFRDPWGQSVSQNKVSAAQQDDRFVGEQSWSGQAQMSSRTQCRQVVQAQCSF